MIEYTGNELLIDKAREHHSWRRLGFTTMDSDHLWDAVYDEAGQHTGNVHNDDPGMTVVFGL